jgi:dolichol-phosphate mannosyltransferase
MSSKQHRLLVALATYNERESLPPLLDRIRQVVPEADILVVDDNSPDGTGQWVDQQAARDARLRSLHRPGKLGLGTATLEILHYAVQHQYDVLITLDADGSHDPQAIPAMLERLHGDGDPPADIVLGSRYVPGGAIEGWPWYRHAMSRAVNLAARLLLNLPVQDCSGAYRCTRVSLVRRADLSRVVSRGYSFFEEILWHYRQAGARFAEVPIVFANRSAGVSKINAAEAARSLAVLFRLGIRNWIGR